MSFKKTYPNLDWWIDGQGWIELGADEYSGNITLRWSSWVASTN